MKILNNFFLAGVLVSSVVAGAASPHYQKVAEIPFKGQGGWDALRVDSSTHRLFVSHADRVVIIDTEKNQVIKEITGLNGVHDIALASLMKKAFITNGKDGSVSVLDLVSLTVKNKIKVGENPDLILFAVKEGNIYCFNGKSHSVSIIDALSEKVITTLELPGKPEFAVADPASERVFVNIEDKNSVVSIDTQHHTIAANWPIEGCDSPTGLALDSKNHRLFSVCENEKMVMIDSQLGKTLTSVKTGEGTDGAEFDPDLGLAFSSNGKTGTVTIVHEDSPSKISVVQTLNTQLGARTLTLDPVNHRLYLPTADFQKAENGQRPKPLDGTQRILVFEPSH